MRFRNKDLPFSSSKEAEKIILAVVVTSHKPLKQFGMEQRFLDEIQELAKTRPCPLVHFGNHLALQHLGELSDFKAVVCAYQGFEETQAQAAAVLNGN